MKKRKKPVKPRKIPDMREGKAAAAAFTLSMGQILHHLAPQKKRAG